MIETRCLLLIYRSSDNAGKDMSAGTLAEVLKFGIEKLLLSSESSLEDTDLDAILGPSTHGHWASSQRDADEATEESQAAKAELQVEDDAERTAADDNIYLFMGEDYKNRKRADDDAFDALACRITRGCSVLTHVAGG